MFEQESAIKTGRDVGGEVKGWDLNVCCTTVKPATKWSINIMMGCLTEHVLQYTVVLSLND